MDDLGSEEGTGIGWWIMGLISLVIIIGSFIFLNKKGELVIPQGALDNPEYGLPINDDL